MNGSKEIGHSRKRERKIKVLIVQEGILFILEKKRTREGGGWLEGARGERGEVGGGWRVLNAGEDSTEKRGRGAKTDKGEKGGLRGGKIKGMLCSKGDRGVTGGGEVGCSKEKRGEDSRGEKGGRGRGGKKKGG